MPEENEVLEEETTEETTITEAQQYRYPILGPRGLSPASGTYTMIVDSVSADSIDKDTGRVEPEPEPVNPDPDPTETPGGGE